MYVAPLVFEVGVCAPSVTQRGVIRAHMICRGLQGAVPEQGILTQLSSSATGHSGAQVCLIRIACCCCCFLNVIHLTIWAYSVHQAQGTGTEFSVPRNQHCASLPQLRMQIFDLLLSQKKSKPYRERMPKAWRRSRKLCCRLLGDCVPWPLLGGGSWETTGLVVYVSACSYLSSELKQFQKGLFLIYFEFCLFICLFVKWSQYFLWSGDLVKRLFGLLWFCFISLWKLLRKRLWFGSEVN